MSLTERRIYSVSQINRYINGLFSKDFILEGLWMKGELSNFKKHSSGHLYFTLKDESSAIGGMMFRADAAILPFTPKDGMQVVVWGPVSVYEKTGQYRILAQIMEPVGIGALALAFTQMKEKLSAEGLFDADYKRELPKHPKDIILITSPTGAAVRDMITVCRRRDPSVQLTIIPALVQGEGAVASIVSALSLANSLTADLIILGRGGGSIEDLWAFNEEAVARAVFASELPVISAVGHETDVTICDFVADLRAPTPSAAAELAVPDRTAKKEHFLQLVSLLSERIEERLLAEGVRMEALMSRPVFTRPEEGILLRRQSLFTLSGRLDRELGHRMEKENSRFVHLIKRMEGVSPLAVLSRGYALVSDEDGRLLTSAGQTEPGDRVEIRLQDGRLRTTVTERLDS